MLKTDLIRLLLVLGLALAAGTVFGRVFLFISIGLLVAIILYFRALALVLDFIRNNREENLPEMPGIVDEISRGVEQLHKDYRQRDLLSAEIINRYEETTAALPDAVIVSSEEGGIEWANKKAGDYLGVKWPMDRGQRLHNLIRSPELHDYLQHWNNRSAPEVLEMVSPVDEEVLIEIRVIRYGASFMLLVARDITEFQRINTVRKDFVANASHELRTPLTVISGYLETLEEDADCPLDWRPKVTQMREQAGRMQRLITDLLELSRLENTRKTGHVEEVSVPDLLEAIFREAAVLGGKRQYEFTKQIDPALYLMADHHDLYHAFSNLVFNAVQYTPVNGRVTVRWYRDATGAHLEVEDTGEGIEQKHLARITERFYRIDKGRSRSRGGTGLGLAIVKHVLTQYNAALHIESTLGRGSLFRCDFPVKICVIRP